MAAGKQHFIADVGITLVSIPLAVYHPELIPEIVIGNVIGTLFSPDIDNESGTYNEILIANLVRSLLIIIGRRKSKATKDVKIIYRLQTALTAAYGVMIPHRSWLSHGPVIGSFTITYYLWLLYFVAGKVASFQTFDYFYLVETYKIASYIIIAHHILHLLMDGAMILFFGKQIYLLGYPFYYLTTKLFPQGEHD